jgi:serine phosphatase RsbU (regulator of sigma subunit)
VRAKKPPRIGESHGDFLDMIPNAPIGLWPGLEFEGESIDTIQGRPLFIYTDGLNEAENPQQEQRRSGGQVHDCSKAAYHATCPRDSAILTALGATSCV